jgi:hypothetical protein
MVVRILGRQRTEKAKGMQYEDDRFNGRMSALVVDRLAPDLHPKAFDAARPMLLLFLVIAHGRTFP